MVYGTVRSLTKPGGPLAFRLYPIDASSSSTRSAILTVPFDFTSGDKLDPALASILCEQFNGEIESGRTYPQEDLYDADGFASYFLAYDLVVGLFLTSEQASSLTPQSSSIPTSGIAVNPSALQSLNLGSSNFPTRNISSEASQATNINLTDWPSTYAFSYYIKPNYIGRSSHLCNGGFMVPMSARGLGLGRIAGRTFLYYAPRCGYRGSIFNLVYASNEASVRIWEKLGFQNIGRIPEAGRIKKANGEGEEFVDAWVVYGDFAKIGYRDE